jgi:hypothetical protein
MFTAFETHVATVSVLHVIKNHLSLASTVLLPKAEGANLEGARH